MVKKVSMSAKIDFTIGGDALDKYNQFVEENNMSLEEQENRFAETLTVILSEELEDCSDLGIEVISTIKEVNEEKESK